MFEVIVGLALLPAAIVVAFYLGALAIGAAWILGGLILLLCGILLAIEGINPGGFICMLFGGAWCAYSWGVVK
jgi:hypothetical protein